MALSAGDLFGFGICFLQYMPENGAYLLLSQKRMIPVYLFLYLDLNNKQLRLLLDPVYDGNFDYCSCLMRWILN